MLGHNTATSGTATGVEGITDSSDNFSAGLRGKATGNNGIIYGAVGPNSLSTDLSAGVHGRYRGSGQGWGTEGITGSEAAGSAGVRGGASQSSGVVYGVRGETNSGDGFGLYTPDDAKSGDSLQFTSGAPDMFIFESGTTNPDQNVIPHSPDFPGWGLRYDDDGDNFVFQSGGIADMTVQLFGTPTLDVHGDARVGGHLDIGDLGASAEQTQDITIQTTPTDVVYQTEVVDDRNEYDPSTGVFTCATAGDYHVDAQVFWDGTPSEGEFVSIAIRRNGTSVRRAEKRWPASTSGGERITQAVSKTMRNLAQNDTINLTAQTGTTSHDIIGISSRANLQISKIG